MNLEQTHVTQADSKIWGLSAKESPRATKTGGIWDGKLMGECGRAVQSALLTLGMNDMERI
jgi:hypothetical protein